MDDSTLVSCFETFSDLFGDRQGFIQLQWPLRDLLIERPTLDQFHRDEGLVVRLIDLVDRANVRMRESGR